MSKLIKQMVAVYIDSLETYQAFKQHLAACVLVLTMHIEKAARCNDWRDSRKHDRHPSQHAVPPL